MNKKNWESNDFYCKKKSILQKRSILSPKKTILQQKRPKMPICDKKASHLPDSILPQKTFSEFDELGVHKP
jgi:hypothetical protein